VAACGRGAGGQVIAKPSRVMKKKIDVVLERKIDLNEMQKFYPNTDYGPKRIGDDIHDW